MEYLVQEPSGLPATAVWVRSRDIKDGSIINSYLQRLENRPKTRASTRRQGVVASMTVQPVLPIRYKTISFLLALFFSLLIGLQSTPKLGPLYDCDVTQYLGIYTFPQPITCKKNFSASGVTTFQSDVFEYRPVSTQVSIFHCVLNYVTLYCAENFFTVKNKRVSQVPRNVNSTICKKALLTKFSPFGPLKFSAPNTWISTSPRQYKCRWLRSTHVSFYELRIDKYPAMLHGNNRIFKQTVTSTPCKYDWMKCVPMELPQSISFWSKSKHSFDVYQNLGLFSVKRINNYFLIPHLGIGGSLLVEMRNSYLLDTGYKLITKFNGSYHSPPHFDNVSASYVTKTKSNIQRDIAQGRLAVELIHDHEVIAQLASTQCETAKETRQLQRWLLASFPNEAAEYLFPGKGKLVESVGDALLIHSCTPVYNYKVFWDKKLNGTCYSSFPTFKADSKRLYFLDLSKRRLYSQGHKVKCSTIKNTTYVIDTFGALWEYSNFSFKKIPSKLWLPRQDSTPLIKIGHFDMRLLHYDEKPLPQTTLLALLNSNKDLLERLSQYSEQGGGDLITGIGSALGNTLSSVAKGGSEIIRSLGAGMRDALSGIADLDTAVVTSIGNATSTVITSSSSGLSKIVSSFGGLSSVILWILVLLLYLYEIGRHRPDRYLFRLIRRRLTPSLQKTLSQKEKPPTPPPRKTNRELNEIQNVQQNNPSFPSLLRYKYCDGKCAEL